ncbi:hypothetical protein ABW21_db0200856 [Orbilia brochopaga]|nr:hypothetical protein ABW21_db0200856 [Drechslerella brochopaga]
MSEHIVSTDYHHVLGYKAIHISSHGTDTTGTTTSLTGTFDIIYHPFTDRYLKGSLGQLCSAMDVAPHIVEEAHREVVRIQGSETDLGVKWVFDPRVYMRDSNFTFCLEKIVNPAVVMVADASRPFDLRTTPGPSFSFPRATTTCCCGSGKGEKCRRLLSKVQEATCTDDVMDLSSMMSLDASSHQNDEGEEYEGYPVRNVAKDHLNATGGTENPMTRDRKRVRLDTDGQSKYVPPEPVKHELHDDSENNYAE